MNFATPPQARKLMKRSPLKRKTPLKRTGFLKRGKPLAKTSPKRRQEMPQMRAWHDAVFERDGDMCVFFPELRGIIAHHIKSRQAWPGLKFDVKNGLRVSQYGHD